jgi:hypothetical protein
MARVYVGAIDTVTVGTAVQDIWDLKAGASNGVRLRWLQLSASGVTTAAELRMRLKRGTVTVTQGSAGTAPSMNLVSDGETKAAGSTLRANDTSQATTSGNFTGFVEYFNWNVLLPWDYMPGPEPDDRPTCLVSEAFILDFVTTIVSTVISGFIRWEEIP